jgi:flagellum-specific peptidoglycan hydrolase FlgJ
MNKLSKTMIIGGIVFIMFLMTCALILLDKYRLESKEIKSMLYKTEPSHFSFYKLCKAHDVKFPTIITAQAILESNYFIKPVRQHNYLGMKIPAKRYCFAINEYDYDEYAEYRSMNDCVADYKSYQKSNAWNIYTSKNYMKFLSENYASDPNYEQKVWKIVQQLEKDSLWQNLQNNSM